VKYSDTKKAPTKREWVSLTVEEKNEITWGKTIYEILELFEAKLREKNT
jgi:S-methylmethionine-dependent homocysteine/selenocysteine methylase